LPTAVGNRPWTSLLDIYEYYLGANKGTEISVEPAASSLS
jgi:hypothetical protein